jgi:hypothetical protein
MLLRALHLLSIQSLELQERIVKTKLGDLEAFKHWSSINPQRVHEVGAIRAKSNSFEILANLRHDRPLVERE